MAYTKEIERFTVKDERGNLHTIVHLQEYVGPKGEEAPGYSSYQTDRGKAVNWHQDTPDIYYLPFGITSPWLESRRI